MVGPAFINGDLFTKGFWIYYTAPFFGGISASVFYDQMFLKHEEDIDDGLEEKEEKKRDKKGRGVYKRDIELSFTRREDKGESDEYNY